MEGRTEGRKKEGRKEERKEGRKEGVPCSTHTYISDNELRHYQR